MNAAKSAIILTAGEALIDLIQESDGRYQPHAGGAVFNAARALALQNIPTAYLNPLSQDRFGQLLHDDLLAAGVLPVQTDLVIEPTSLAVVSLDANGSARYGFYRDGIADKAINAAKLIEFTQQCAKAQWAITGCLALTPDSIDIYLPWLQHCRHQGIKVAVDANLRLVVSTHHDAYRKSVLAALALADVIKVSDEDLEALKIADLQSLWQISQAQWIVVTLGAKGASCFGRTGNPMSLKESRPLTVVDTVGAGDCFLAGFISALVRADDWTAPAAAQQGLARGIAAASINVQRSGCQPPSTKEIDTWLHA
jgi:fructokinase